MIFLAQALDFGGLWSFNVPNILVNEPMFNYFFGLIMAFGLMAVPIAVIVRLISRS